MHELLFETRTEWGEQENPREKFIEYAADLDLDAEAFTACLDSGDTTAQVQDEYEQGLAVGVESVPAFYINDWFIGGAQEFAVFQQVIEAALRGEHPTPTPTPLPPGVSPFDPNPERPGYTYSGDAYHGSEEAEIMLVEFVDFQSADNRQHYLEVWPDLEENYLETGQVRLIVKYFPALDHAQGFQAAEAAECAAQQDAFWPMYDLLFQQQEEWSQSEDVSATLKEYAAELDLDTDAFATCLDEGQTSDKVQQDFAIGAQNQFPPAPVFFIFMGDMGGYVPSEQLQDVIEQLLVQEE